MPLFRTTTAKVADVNDTSNQYEGYTKYILSWLQIVLFSFALWAFYIFPPFQPPQKGLLNNWIFMFISLPIGSISMISVYSYWGRLFIDEFHVSPVFVCTVGLMILYYLICEFYTFPVTGMGIMVIAVVTIAYPISLYISSVVIGKRKAKEFLKSLKDFSKFRAMIGALYLVCCAYIILFNHVHSNPDLQRVSVVIFNLLVFVVKFFVQDFTRRTVPFEKCSLVVFWFEYYYEFFSLSVFPSITNIETFVVFMVLKVFSLNLSLCLLTDSWWLVKTRAYLFENTMKEESEPEIEPAGPAEPEQSAKPAKLAEPATDSPVDFTSTLDTVELSRISSMIRVQSSSREGAISDIMRANSYDLRVVISEPMSLPKQAYLPKQAEKYVTKKAKVYSTVRRMVFTDLDRSNLRHYIVLNCFYSIAAHIICPIFWIPMSYFLKYGYNQRYFVYYFFTDKQFITSLQYAAISLLVSVGVLIVAYFIVLRYFKISMFKISKVYVIEDMWFFIFSISSATCICWSMLSEQHNIAWAFYHHDSK